MRFQVLFALALVLLTCGESFARGHLFGRHRSQGSGSCSSGSCGSVQATPAAATYTVSTGPGCSSCPGCQATAAYQRMPVGPVTFSAPVMQHLPPQVAPVIRRVTAEPVAVPGFCPNGRCPNQ